MSLTSGHWNLSLTMHGSGFPGYIVPEIRRPIAQVALSFILSPSPSPSPCFFHSATFILHGPFSATKNRFIRLQPPMDKRNEKQKGRLRRPPHMQERCDSCETSGFGNTRTLLPLLDLRHLRKPLCLEPRYCHTGHGQDPEGSKGK